VFASTKARIRSFS